MFTWIRCSAAAVFLAALPAAAVPVSFQLETISNTATRWTLVNGPIVGSGDLVFDASGNLLSGSFSLPAWAFLVDGSGDGIDDFQFDISATTQTLAAAPLVGGEIDLAGGSATGTSSCTILPNAAPGGICTPPSNVLPYGTDGSNFTATATLDFTRFTGPNDFAGTVTSVTVRTAANGSQSTQTLVSRFSTLPVPEPSAHALLAAPLALAALGKRRRS